MSTAKDHFEYVQSNDLLLVQKKSQHKSREQDVIVLSRLYISFLNYYFLDLDEINMLLPLHMLLESSHLLYPNLGFLYCLYQFSLILLKFVVKKLNFSLVYILNFGVEL